MVESLESPVEVEVQAMNQTVLCLFLQLNINPPLNDGIGPFIPLLVRVNTDRLDMAATDGSAWRGTESNLRTTIDGDEKMPVGNPLSPTREMSME